MSTQQQVLAAAGDRRDFVRAGEGHGFPTGGVYPGATRLSAEAATVAGAALGPERDKVRGRRAERRGRAANEPAAPPPATQDDHMQEE